MTPQFDPARSAGIRQLLIDTATDPRHRRPRATLIAGVLLAGMAVGAGASTAAFAASGGFTEPAIAQPSGQPSPELPPAVEAPPGTQPGAPVVSMIGGPSVIALSAPAERSLADRPAGATHVRVTISALTAGSVSWGTDADGNNPSAAFTADDLHAANGAVSWFDFPLDESTPTFFLQPSVGFTASVSFQYLNQTPTHLKRNANGETYGVAGGPDGDPDLVAVTATAADGSLAEGYARASDLAAFSPEHPHQPSTPEEATSWQEERDAAYPRGWSVPVFESDGETQIGTFHIG